MNDPAAEAPAPHEVVRKRGGLVLVSLALQMRAVFKVAHYLIGLISQRISRKEIEVKKHPKYCLLISVALATVLTASEAQGQPLPPSELRELIVLLKSGPGRPDPGAVVSAINSGNPVPNGLGDNNPIYAERLTQPPKGRLLQFVRDHPDSPEARAPYYLRIGYNANVNLDAVALSLQNNPNVISTEINKAFRFHSASAPTKTTDELVGTGTSTPSNGQWVLHLLNVPAALNRTTAHGQVGILDLGLERAHEDLAPFSTDKATGERTLGPFRAHLSESIPGGCNVDEHEVQPEDTTLGHGTMVSGLIAASSFNGRGIMSPCWDCAIQVVRVEASILNFVFNALNKVIGNGAQAVNMSFGLDEGPCVPGDERLVCNTIQLAANRDIVLVASAGNDLTAVEFPGNDPNVISVGGLEWVGTDTITGTPIAQLWSEEPNCPEPGHVVPTHECGSNFGPALDLVSGAKDILSTMYTGFDWRTDLDCGDSLHPAVGYGPCRGTSAAAPSVVGVVMEIRSVNPLLSRDDVYVIITSTASDADNRTDELGFGYPNAEAAVILALGRVNGKILVNRLTPLFSFFGISGNPDPVGNPDFRLSETWFYTSVPSIASGMLLDAVGVDIDPFQTAGPKVVPGYTVFPGLPSCGAPCDTVPRASIYVYTTRREPFPGATELVPLYRLRYDPDILRACDLTIPMDPVRDFTFVTTPDEAWSLYNTQGYLIDVVEGYIFKSCEGQPGCAPPEGTVKVYQAFNPTRHDHALFPESELADMQANGYVEDVTVMGYAYPNVDTDGDTLIDGFEEQIGTDPKAQDTDCDGVTDGMEILRFDQAQRQYGDPLLGPCWTPDTIFANGFESGDTSRWSAVTP